MVFSSSFYNLQIKTTDYGAVVQAMRAVGVVPAYVSDSINGWISIFPQETRSIRSYAEKLSKKVDAPVFGMSMHDSEVMDYALYENGVLKDEFESAPGDIAKPPKGGNIEVLLKYAGEGVTKECIGNIMAGKVKEALHELGIEESAAETAPVEATGEEMVKKNLKNASWGQKVVWSGAMLLNKVNEQDAAKRGLNGPAFGGELYGHAVGRVLGLTEDQLFAEYDDFQCLDCIDDEDSFCDHRTVEGLAKGPQAKRNDKDFDYGSALSVHMIRP
jgi:hypothetical protein